MTGAATKQCPACGCTFKVKNTFWRQFTDTERGCVLDPDEREEREVEVSRSGIWPFRTAKYHDQYRVKKYTVRKQVLMAVCNVCDEEIRLREKVSHKKHVGWTEWTTSSRWVRHV